MKKTLFIILIALVVGVGLPVACTSDRSENDLGSAGGPIGQQGLRQDVDVTPVWDDAAADVVQIADSLPRVFRLLWDRSIPMGGYIDPHPDSISLPHNIQEFLKSVRLASDFGHADISLECSGISDQIVAYDCATKFGREFFDGGNSRMDLAISQVTSDILDGTVVGAALITDLMATTEFAVGATSLLPYLRDASLRAHFNNGSIHVALVGIKAAYWGIRGTGCRTEPPGSPGCWFNEGTESYQPLDSLIQRPLYVLLVGRSIKAPDRRVNPVVKMAQALQEAIAKIDLHAETLLDLFTHGTIASTDRFFWLPMKQEGFQPVDLLGNGYDCKQDGTFDLSGTFADSSIVVMDTRVDSRDSLYAGASEVRSVARDSVKFSLYCEHVRSNEDKICSKADDGRATNVTVRLRHQAADQSRLDSWSSVEHDPASTLYLDDFLDGLRPSYYEAAITPFPPIACR